MEEDNIIKFPGTVLDIVSEEQFGPSITVNDVIEGVKERDFDDVIVIGTWQGNDSIYFASTSGNLPLLNWQLEKAKFILMQASFDMED